KNPAYVPRNEPADGLAGGKVAKVDRVEWIYIPDGNTATAALMNGEVDMIMPVTDAARFDGHGAGWLVYGPGSAHRPTVTQGRALVLYLLPGAAIEFTRA
ncbi:DUF4863 family protein, partial [Enterobacter sp. DRP3]|nr:DUF4863 family protein [Enterobacter sp. DRP3]